MPVRLQSFLGTEFLSKRSMVDAMQVQARDVDPLSSHLLPHEMNMRHFGSSCFFTFGFPVGSPFSLSFLTLPIAGDVVGAYQKISQCSQATPCSAVFYSNRWVQTENFFPFKKMVYLYAFKEALEHNNVHLSITFISLYTCFQILPDIFDCLVQSCSMLLLSASLSILPAKDFAFCLRPCQWQKHVLRLPESDSHGAFGFN